MNPLLVFVLGSLSGAGLTMFLAWIVHSEKVRQLMHEFTSKREETRRCAYARGYEDASMKRLPTGKGAA